MGVISTLVSLFLVMLVGVAAGKSHAFDESSRKVISKFVFYIATSALIVDSIISINIDDLQKLPRFIIASSVFYAGLVVILFAVLRLLKIPYKKGASILYAGTVANTIYLGLPVIKALYGLEGVLYAVATFTIPLAVTDIFDFYILSMWRRGTASIATILKDFLKNPLVLSTFVGIMLLALRVHLPQSVMASLNFLGSGATGLALFAMGLFLASTSLKNLKVIEASAGAVIKLFIVPALALLVGHLFGLSGVGLSVMVLMAAMPSAIFCMIVATEYEFDEQATANIILASSLGFIATSVFWASVLR